MFAAIVAAGGAGALGVSAANLVQAQSPAPSGPWTGAGYGFAQHHAVMQLNMDQAAIAMARTARQSAKDDAVKRLADAVVAERTKDLDAGREAYRKEYGAAPPAWPGTQSRPGYGPGMMGGGYGSGMMRGGGRPGGWYGPMMAQGDAWQGMMGWRGGWWQGSDADRGFPAALVRLDAMQISMATLALQGGDAALRERARAIVAARTGELTRAGALLK